MPSLQVRFSSLLMLTELASKLKENYMVLLPETIPFLAELMEGEEPSTDCFYYSALTVFC